LGRAVHRLRYAVTGRLEREASRCDGIESRLKRAVQGRLQHGARQLDQSQLRMELLDPKLVLQRGYALLADAQGRAVTSVRQTHPGQFLVATLADGEVDLEVTPPPSISS
jgi:exodeoxyribonuclease VII large subunit